jgi:exosortase
MSMRPSVTDFRIPLMVAVALWFPAMAGASHAWRFGGYYDYGWFVPPAAMWLMVRRWQDPMDAVRAIPFHWTVVAVSVLLPWFLILRVMGRVDPAWRLPVVLCGLTAAVAGHLLLAGARGWRHSAGYLWITLLLCSALPWPSAVESGLVQWLTGRIVAFVAEWFQWFGRPVETLGDRLRLNEVTVEVTDGCSGVRSFQSFFMATWFFAELQRLRAGRAWLLLAAAFTAAFVVNVVRVYALAWIRFEHGMEAFVRAHDWLGWCAFLAGALFFHFMSGALAGAGRRVLIKRRMNNASSRSGLS